MEKRIAPVRILVLKSNASLSEIQNIAEKKKSKLFGTALTRPNPNEIQVASTDLFF